MREERSTLHEPLRPHQVNIQPGTLFSYAMFSQEEGVWGHFEDRWLVVEASAPNRLAGIDPVQSITAVNQRGRISHTYLYASDRIVVHCG